MRSDKLHWFILLVSFVKMMKYNFRQSSAFHASQIRVILHKNMMLGRKQHFVPKKSHFGQSGLRNSPPSGQTATYRKTEGTQSYLRICGTYDPIELGRSDPKKWGLYRRSEKKCIFFTLPMKPPFFGSDGLNSMGS